LGYGGDCLLKSETELGAWHWGNGTGETVDFFIDTSESDA